MKPCSISWLLLAACAAGTSPAAAQSLQRWSVQGVGVYLFRRSAGCCDVSENRRSAGGEVQLRYTFAVSRVSVGVGYQESVVRSGFIEPRVVLTAGERLGFYASGRAGIAKLVCAGGAPCESQKLEQLLGAGGGFLVQLNRRFALDLGALYYFTYYTPAGQVGLRQRTGWGQLRGGVSAGF